MFRFSPFASICCMPTIFSGEQAFVHRHKQAAAFLPNAVWLYALTNQVWVLGARRSRFAPTCEHRLPINLGI